MVKPSAQRDYVDELIGVLADSHGDDLRQAKALAYRIRRLAHRMETEIARELAPHGVELRELELLACLIRAEPHHRLSAGTLMAQLQLTSGAVTNRVARLEAKGWVVRDFAPDDRRSVLVTLTQTGRERAMEVFGVKTEAEHRLLSALPPTAQQRLNDDLRGVLLALEGPAQGTGPGTRADQRASEPGSVRSRTRPGTGGPPAPLATGSSAAATS